MPDIKNQYNEKVGSYEAKRDGYVIRDRYGNETGHAEKEWFGDEYNIYNKYGEKVGKTDTDWFGGGATIRDNAGNRTSRVEFNSDAGNGICIALVFIGLIIYGIINGINRVLSSIPIALNNLGLAISSPADNMDTLLAYAIPCLLMIIAFIIMRVIVTRRCRFIGDGTLRKFTWILLFVTVELSSIVCGLVIGIDAYAGYLLICWVGCVIPVLVLGVLVEYDGVTSDLTEKNLNRIVPGYVLTFDATRDLPKVEYLCMSSQKKYGSKLYHLFMVVDNDRGDITDDFKVCWIDRDGAVHKETNLTIVDALAPKFMDEVKRNCSNEQIISNLERQFRAIHQFVSKETPQ